MAFTFCSVVMTVDGTSTGRTDNDPGVWKGITPSLGSVMSLAVLTCCPRLKEGSCSKDCPFFPFFLFWCSVVVPCGKFGSPCPDKAEQPQEQLYTHFYQCVQGFRVSKQWFRCQCLGFFTCTQMLMRAIAHVGCSDTVRESALKVDFARTTTTTTTTILLIITVITTTIMTNS